MRHEVHGSKFCRRGIGNLRKIARCSLPLEITFKSPSLHLSSEATLLCVSRESASFAIASGSITVTWPESALWQSLDVTPVGDKYTLQLDVDFGDGTSLLVNAKVSPSAS